MGGLSATLEIAKNTLLNSQIQLQTASHNIANADNPAYARQTAQMTTNPPMQVQAGYLGMGAAVQSVVQSRNQFVEKQLTDASSSQAQYQTQATEYTNVENGIADNGQNGISQSLTNFWNGWEGVNQNPTGTTEKTVLNENTQSLASTINDAYSSLSNEAQSVESQLSDSTNQVNGLLNQVAGYNSDIVTAEIGGQPANDLRDQRYAALTKLAQYLPVKSTEQADGSITLTIQDNSNSITLVSGSQAGSLQYDETANPPQLSYKDYQQNSSNYGSLSGGSIEGLLNVYQSVGTAHDMNYVLANPNDPSLTYLDRLNAFAASLTNNVNSVNSQAGGSNVFDFTAAQTGQIGQISVDPNFQPDSNQALAMTDLQDQSMPELNNSTLSGYLGDIQQRIGLDVQNSTNQSDAKQALVTQLQAQQQSVSGVSIDEETVNIMQYQQIYSAAAKVIQTTASMLNTAINMVSSS